MIELKVGKIDSCHAHPLLRELRVVHPFCRIPLVWFGVIVSEYVIALFQLKILAFLKKKSLTGNKFVIGEKV